jgi:hypothetical protein
MRTSLSELVLELQEDNDLSKTVASVTATGQTIALDIEAARFFGG